MRTVQIRCLLHSSGTEVPLLCIGDQVDRDNMEFILPAMPFVAGNGRENAIRYFLEEHRNRINFELSLDFGYAGIKKHYASLYVYNGVLSLLKDGRALAEEKYEGVYPYFRFKSDFDIAGTSQDVWEGFQLKNRFSFRHPDDHSRMIEFEFRMPLPDLFAYSGFNPGEHTKRYRFDIEELRYSEVTTPAKSRNKLKAEPGKIVLLQKENSFINQQSRIIDLQSSKISAITANTIAAGRLTTVNKIQTGLVLADLGYIDSVKKPDLPVQPAVAPGVFKDWKNNKVIWCQDELHVSPPAPGTPFAASPFRFLFRVKGLSPQGQPVLESEITVTLKRQVSKLAANYPGYSVKRISPANLSVSVTIPYTDNNGNPQLSTIGSSTLTTTEGSITATFLLNNEWSRIAYAALSSDNVITRNIKLSVSYLFRAYSKIMPGHLSLVSLNKIDRLQVLKHLPRAFEPTSSVFVASQNTLISPAGISIKYNSLKPQTTPALLTLALPQFSGAGINIIPQKQEEVLEKVEYKTDNLLYNNEFELSFPCTDMGEYYQEEKDGESNPIGCREPYKLGEADRKLFAEMPGLSTARYKILRSLQVPNRFVIVPARYVVSRNPADAPEPFSPALIVYSTFDVNNPSASHAVINAILQPDIPYYTFLEIREALREFTVYEPDLQFITSTEAENEFLWTLPESLYLANSAAVTGNLVSYSLTGTIANALTIINMIKQGGAGITGVLKFLLPDGSRFTSSLFVNIGGAEGPWMDTPLKISQAPGTIYLENLLRTPVDIAGYYYEQAGKISFESLNTALESNGKYTAAAQNRENIVPHYRLHPQENNINEIHTYLENINCQILFINTSGKDMGIYKEITILYSLQGDENAMAGIFRPEDSPLEVMLPIPLTSYLGQRTIRYKIRAKKDNSSPTETSWQEVSLTNGNIIDIGPTINLHL